MNVKQESSFRILFLLNLLYNNEFSKNEIIEEFKKNNTEIKKTSINNYINKLRSYNIPVAIRKVKNVNYYSLDKNNFVSLRNDEIDSSNDVKRLIMSEKNCEIIKNVMRIFYKFALHVDNNNIKEELINFGYYSKINWMLVKQLEKHCREKNIIEIDYLLPDNKNKNLTIHADTIKIGDFSDRLYLSGILDGDNKLSQLPVDKIFMIKKIIKKNVRINLETGVLSYKVSNKMFKKTGLDKKEGLGKIENDIVTIRRPLDDTFFTIQRLMYFCPELYYISDNKIKNLVKEKLYTLKDMYSSGNEE